MVDISEYSLEEIKSQKKVNKPQNPIVWLKEILLIIGMSWSEFCKKTGFDDEYDSRMPYSLSLAVKQRIAEELHLQYRTVEEKFFKDL